MKPVSGLSRALLLAAAVTALVAGPALAASGGGGGGGGAPSASAPSFDAAKRYSEGVTALQASNFKVAQKAFDSILDMAPKDPNTNFMMSLSLIGQENFKDARKYLRNTVKYDKSHIQGRGWLGAVEAKLGDAGKANEQKTALVDMKTKCAGTCPDAAKIDSAIALVDNSLATPDAPLTLSGELTRFASAKDGDAAYLAAYALINEGHYQDALYSLHEASLVFGPHPDVLTYQGFANRKLHNYETAIGFYAAALSLDPRHRGANEYLGEYYVETGQMAKAKVQLAKLDTICAFGCEQAEELRRWIAGEKS